MAVRVDEPRTPKGFGKRAAPKSSGGFFDTSPFVNGGQYDLTPQSVQDGSWTEVVDPRIGSGKSSVAQNPIRGRGGAVVKADAPMTFADYLALAQQYMSESGAGAPDYSAIEEALQQKALQSDAKLAAMYKQLHGSIDADAPTIAGQYDQAAASIGQNADQAAGNINSAYQASRDNQTQQLAALGIQDAASVLAAKGGNAAADQAHAVGNIEQNRATGQNQAALNKGSALDYNTNIGNAAILGGTEARGTIQSQLMDALAELAMRKSEAQTQSGSSALDLAFQLQDRDGSAGGSPQDQQALAELLYRQQNDQTNRSADLWQTLLRLYDGDTQKAAQAYAQSQASGLA